MDRKAISGQLPPPQFSFDPEPLRMTEKFGIVSRLGMVRRMVS